MKIAGLTYLQGERQLYLKPDTALLVNRKPFFLPHFTEDIVMHPCIVARIDRMGRCIAERFAGRYYSEIAPALNVQAKGMEGGNLDKLTRGIVFDNSFPVGKFSETDPKEMQWNYDGKVFEVKGLIEDLNKAVALVSEYITLRTGDMVAVDLCCDGITAEREKSVSVTAGNEEILYCKIK